MTTRAQEVREAFAYLRRADPVLAGLIEERPDYDPDAWLEELPDMDLFGCLVFQIAGQQISIKASRAILGRLAGKFDGERIPRAEEVAGLDEQTLCDIGFSRRKAKTVLDLAGRCADGRLSEERLRELPDGSILEELTRIPGIGPWTVHGALLVSLRRPDVVPAGDLILRNAVKTHYGFERLPTEKEVVEIAAAWRPYGSLGANLLFAATAPE